MGFKIQSSKFFIVRENYADKEGTVLISKWIQELDDGNLADILDGLWETRDRIKNSSTRKKIGMLFPVKVGKK